MQLLFPSNPFSKFAVDDAYAEEFESAHLAGAICHLFSYEEFETGEFKLRSTFGIGEKVLYRGWMLTPEKYSVLHDAVSRAGGSPVTTPTQFRLCHYLPEWYSLCAEFTPNTVVVPRDADFIAAVAGKGWSAYFVKDYVKSLTTSRGSMAATAQEIATVVSLIEKFKGSIEGGVCIREFERFEPETEQRYFVLNGRAYSQDEVVPGLVHEIAKRIRSPFFSVDVVVSEGGQMRLIELGDGQVSDRKSWLASSFISMLFGQ